MAASLALVLALAPPPAPTVAGPRDTESASPTYVFRSRGAVRFLCAFDSRRLHRCAARYSQRLAPGRHVLRVQAVSRDGKRSRITSVVVVVREAIPALRVAWTVKVGNGSGVPAVSGGATWVPNAFDGTATRVDSTSGAVVATLPFPRTPADAGGFLDSAVTASGSICAASDHEATVVRIDPATNLRIATIVVPPRPPPVAAGGAAAWVRPTARWCGS